MDLTYAPTRAQVNDREWAIERRRIMRSLFRSWINPRALTYGIM
jgi:hypothetical protein